MAQVYVVIGVDKFPVSERLCLIVTGMCFRANDLLKPLKKQLRAYKKRYLLIISLLYPIKTYPVKQFSFQ